MKKLLSVLMAVVLCSIISVSAYAAPAPINADGTERFGGSSVITTDETPKPQPRLDKSLKVYLTTSDWSGISGDNNALNVTLKVTNHSSNSGPIYVKIVKSDGSNLHGSTEIATGSSKSFSIGAFSGHYNIDGKAKETAGNYTIALKDSI